MLPKSAHSNLDRENSWLEVDSCLELDSGSSYLLLSERKGGSKSKTSNCIKFCSKHTYFD